MSIVQANVPTKRKNSLNQQNKKNFAKKAKIEAVKTTQSTQKEKPTNKKTLLQKNAQKANKKNKTRADAENGSPKKLKQFAGTKDIQSTKKEQKKDKIKDVQTEKKKRRDPFLTLSMKIKSGEKQEAVKLIDDKIKAIEGRDELTKTAKRKMKRLKHLKNIAEGKEPVQQKQQKDPHGKSESTKRRIRKKKNTEASNSKNVKKAAQIINKSENKEDSSEESDDESEEAESGAEEELEGESEEGDDIGTDDEVPAGEESDEEGEEAASDEEEGSVEEEGSDEDDSEEVDSEEDIKTKDAKNNSEDGSPDKRLKLYKEKIKSGNKSETPKTVNLEELEKHKLVVKNQKRFVLFVGNIPYDTNKQDLIQHFQKCGEIKDIRIPTDKKSSKPRGFGYVEVGNEESYQKLLSMHHSFLKGRRLNVLYTQGGKKKGEEKKKEIKAKNYKLHAMRKQGKLAGSIKENQKRSFRRAKQRTVNKNESQEET